ncbi:MAG TPA: cysteine desulfurase [Atopostipes sp.]|nr:cysteine desulfurase [Atopostipes sp.]
MEINWRTIRDDFPILKRSVYDQPLIYLDNAATTQKPKQVIEAITNYYQAYNANVYRGIHTLSGESTEVFDSVRQQVADFIGAKEKEEIVFTSGTTASINDCARSLSFLIEEGDEILLTAMEHHSNIIPWQQLAKEKGAHLRYAELSSDGEMDLEDFKEKLTSNTKIVAFTHVSNTLGTINPVKKMTQLAHEVGAIVVVDGAQAVSHFQIDVEELDVDFYAFSAHKMYGPTGIGVLYGKRKWLEAFNPANFGGEMIEYVGKNESTWAAIPHKFEAGTPNISGVIGLGAAIRYIENIGLKNIEAYEQKLTNYLLAQLEELEWVQVYGPLDSESRSGVVMFNLEDVHSHDLATALDLDGIAIRAGHHCAQILMRRLGIVGSARASLCFYNSKEEIDQFIQSLTRAKEFFADEE